MPHSFRKFYDSNTLEIPYLDTFLVYKTSKNKKYIIVLFLLYFPLFNSAGDFE